MLNSRSPWFPLRDENNEIYWFNYETHERMTSIPHNHRKWIENLNKPIVGLSKEQIEYKYIEMFSLFNSLYDDLDIILLVKLVLLFILISLPSLILLSESIEQESM